MAIVGGSRNNEQQQQLMPASSFPAANFMQLVSTGFDVLLNIFGYLKVQELQRAARVCRMWNIVANNSNLWKTVRMKNSNVNDFNGFVKTLKRNDTIHLDLRKILLSNQEEAWKEFSEKIRYLDQLERIDLCRCHSSIVESLLQSNPTLKCINAVSLKDDKIDLSGLAVRLESLIELRLRSLHASGLQLLKIDFKLLDKIQHLSLTTIENLHLLLNNNQSLREMTQLQSLELGHCDQLNDELFAENLSFLSSLTRLRLEKGLQAFSINKVLAIIPKKLLKLVQLELINCDIKKDFVESIHGCKSLKRLLLIPTYVSQSAATNFMIMKGVMGLSTLDVVHWVVTNELLKGNY